MSQSYVHIATISVAHEYYEEGMFKSLEQSFNSEDALLLHSLGMVINSFSGGFGLYSTQPELLQTLEEGSAIRFELGFDNYNFYSFACVTHLQFPSELFWYDNVINLSDREETQELRRVDNSKARQEENIRDSSWGVLDIDLRLLYLHYKERDSAVNYSIHLAARKTYWKYYIIEGQNHNFNDLRVVDTSFNILFERIAPSNVELARIEAHSFSVFISKSAIALSEVPKEHFALIDQVSATDQVQRVIIKHLPMASPHNIAFTQNDENTTWFSDIYVYV